MKHFNMKIGTVLLLTALPVITLSQLSAARDQNSRTIYVSLVTKNSVNRYLNRLASDSAQLVVTAEPVKDALATKTLISASDAQLILVELDPEHLEKIPGERLRLDHFAVVEMPVLMDIHEFAGLKSFAEVIAKSETQVSHPEGLFQKSSISSDSVSTLKIEQTYLEEKLKLFSGATAASIDGKTVTIKERGSKTGKDNARSFLKQEYEAIGFTVIIQPYGFFKAGSNFVAEKTGLDPSKVLVLTSHMDSVNNLGADDNGSGTIGALAIATALKDTPLRYTLRIVAFDQEEDGLVGSAAYAKALNASGEIKDLIGAINLEMTGYDADDDGALHIIDCNEGTSSELSAALMKVIDRDPLRLSRVAACTNRSDHASFWKYNVPAVVISQNFFGGDGNPCYHKSCDKVDIVQFDYMTRVTTAVGRAVAEIVSLPVPVPN